MLCDLAVLVWVFLYFLQSVPIWYICRHPRDAPSTVRAPVHALVALRRETRKHKCWAWWSRSSAHRPRTVQQRETWKHAPWTCCNGEKMTIIHIWKDIIEFETLFIKAREAEFAWKMSNPQAFSLIKYLLFLVISLLMHLQRTALIPNNSFLWWNAPLWWAR